MLYWFVMAPAGIDGASACTRQTTSLFCRYRLIRRNSTRWRTSGTISGAISSACVSGTTTKPSWRPVRRPGSSSSVIPSASIPSLTALGHGSILRAPGTNHRSPTGADDLGDGDAATQECAEQIEPDDAPEFLDRRLDHRVVLWCRAARVIVQDMQVAELVNVEVGYRISTRGLKYP